MALIVAFVVRLPTCSPSTRWRAKQRIGVLRQIVRNPLIIATLAGLVCNQLAVEISQHRSQVSSHARYCEPRARSDLHRCRADTHCGK